MNDLSEIRGECLNSIYETADNVLKYVEGSDKTKHIQSLKSLVSKYCVLDYQTQVCEEALNSVVHGVDVATLSGVDEKFVKVLKTLISRRPNTDDHPAMLEFLDKLNTPDTELNESDIVETESSQVFIDPITKTRIVTPVKNKHCGHVYEKSSITALLSKKSVVRCPVMGCGNRRNIEKADLILDENLRIKLSQMAVDPLADDSD